MSVHDDLWKVSKWCRLFSKERFSALYHTLNMGVVFMPKQISERLFRMGDTFSLSELSVLGLSDQLLSALVSEKLINPFNTDEEILFREIRDKIQNDNYLDVMYLLVTDNCNFKCRYCFEDTPEIKSTHTFRNMTENVASRAVEMFAGLTTKYGRKGGKKVINIYGGEPLLNIPAIREAVFKHKALIATGQMPSACKVSIVTNGSLLTDEIAHFFASFDVNMGLSIDGPSEINNIYRKSKREALDAFKEAFRGYKIAVRQGVKVGLSVTLTQEVVDNFEVVLDFFNTELKEKAGIGFNILHYSPKIKLGDDYFEKAAECILKAYTSFRKLGVYEERIMRKVESFIDRMPIYADCGVIGNQIVISPDGSVGVCQDFVKPKTYFQSSILMDDFDPFKVGLFDEWKLRSPFYMDECKNCEAIAICGGGCPASIELQTGNRWHVDKRICPHSKLSLEWLIWDTFQKIVS